MRLRIGEVGEEVIKSGRVFYIVGRHRIIINDISDKIRDANNTENQIAIDLSDVEDGLEVSENTASQGMVDFDTFRSVINTQSMYGKWVCKVELKSIGTKQKQWLELYTQHPSSNGVLIIVSEEFKEYASVLKSRTLRDGIYSHLIEVSFPSRKDIKILLRNEMHKYNKSIMDAACEMVVTAIGDDCDSIPEVAREIAEGHPSTSTIDKKDAAASLRNMERSVRVDDFLEVLTDVFYESKPTAKKAYKMLAWLTGQWEPKKLLQILNKEINNLIDIKVIINQGLIPANVETSGKEIRKVLGEESELGKLSDYKLKRTKELAELTSLRDWVFMKEIVNKGLSRFRDDECEAYLYELVSRNCE